ncbi:hypothetical protein [Corallococcus sp. RDP092CA]|uniref:hypothetical protein n=1 Tax=Corallococcus sp. RDP092CA TaxID=3109369 RepID=UPI0035B3E0C1
MTSLAAPQRRCCITVRTPESGPRERCTAPALDDADFCERCAEASVQEGEADSLRCPWCDEFGDFAHAAEHPATEWVDHLGPPGREVECASCRCKSYVLEARLWLRIQRVPLPEEVES